MLSAKEVKEKYKITSQTLYNWRRLNKIKFVKTPSGKFLYTQLEEELPKEKRNVIYARVSNTKQKEDLERQINLIKSFMISRGIKVDFVYFDIASGMNENRTSFNKLIQECVSGNIETIYISYKDRLTRFGFNYMSYILSLHDVKIEVLNSTKEEDFQQELTQDLVSIIHHFSMKLYSNRRKTLKDTLKLLKTDDNN